MTVATEVTAERDALLKLGRALLYPGLALSSLLVIRGVGGLTFGDLLLGGAAVCTLYSQARPGRGLPAPLWAAALLVLLGGLAAALVTRSPLDGLAITGRLLYLVIVLPLALLNLLVTRRHFGKAIAWWLAGAAFSSAGALVQLVAGDVIPGTQVTAAARYSGFTQNVSDLGAISAVGAAALLALATAPGIGRRTRQASIIGLLACIAGLVLSGSVSGMIGLAAALLLLLARRGVRLRWVALVAAISAAVLTYLLTRQTAAGGLTPLDRILQTTGTRAQDSDLDTSAIRGRLAELAWARIQEAPLLGHGMSLRDNLLTPSLSVHNVFLATWHAGGLLTLAGVLIATVLAVRAAWRRVDPIGEALTAALLAAVLFAQTAPSFYNRYYWLPVALVIVYRYLPRSARQERIPIT